MQSRSPSNALEYAAFTACRDPRLARADRFCRLEYGSDLMAAPDLRRVRQIPEREFERDISMNSVSGH